MNAKEELLNTQITAWEMIYFMTNVSSAVFDTFWKKGSVLYQINHAFYLVMIINVKLATQKLPTLTIMWIHLYNKNVIYTQNLREKIRNMTTPTFSPAIWETVNHITNVLIHFWVTSMLILINISHVMFAKILKEFLSFRFLLTVMVKSTVQRDIQCGIVMIIN